MYWSLREYSKECPSKKAMRKRSQQVQHVGGYESVQDKLWSKPQLDRREPEKPGAKNYAKKRPQEDAWIKVKIEKGDITGTGWSRKNNEEDRRRPHSIGGDFRGLSMSKKRGTKEGTSGKSGGAISKESRSQVVT